MSRKTTRRRRTALTNPIALALHKATGFTPVELSRIEVQLRGHFDALRSGDGTRYHFAGVCTACELGLAIESRGIVRGLRDQLQAAERLLLELKGKAEIGGGVDQSDPDRAAADPARRADRPASLPAQAAVLRRVPGRLAADGWPRDELGRRFDS